MANRKTSRGGESAADLLARASWRLSRLPLAEVAQIEQCLAARAEVIRDLRRRITGGGAETSDLAVLREALEAGNALLSAWRSERDQLRREMSRRHTEILLLRANSAGPGNAGHPALRG